MSEINPWHVGRGWSGHRIEDECPCPQEACGLVDITKFHPGCEQHKIEKTTRQGHSPQRCPGTPSTKEGGAA